MTAFRLYQLQDRSPRQEDVIVIANQQNQVLVDQVTKNHPITFYQAFGEVWSGQERLLECLLGTLQAEIIDGSVRIIDYAEQEPRRSPLHVVGRHVGLFAEFSREQEMQSVVLGRRYSFWEAKDPEKGFNVVKGYNIAEDRVREWFVQYCEMRIHNIRANQNLTAEIGVLTRRIEELKAEYTRGKEVRQREMSLTQLLV